MPRKLLSCLVTLLVGGFVIGQGIIESTEQIARQLAAAISSAGYRSVAVVDPLSATNDSSAFGRFLAEELSGAMVNSGQLRVIDRLSLQRILEEQRLSVSGLVSDADAVQRIGDLAGVEVLILGTYFVLGDSVRLSLKGLNVQTAENVGAINATLPLDAGIQSLLGSHGMTSSGPLASGAESETNDTASFSSNVTTDPATGDFFVYDLCDSEAWIEVRPSSMYSSVSFSLVPNSGMNGRVLVFAGTRLGLEVIHTATGDRGKSTPTSVLAQVGPNPATNNVRIEIEKYREFEWRDWNCGGVFTIRELTTQ